MRAVAPSPALTRPSFWPWPPGQSLGVSEHHVISSDVMLLLHSLLAASTPTTGWDAGPFLDMVGLEMDDVLPRGVLRTLEAYRLARFEPEYTAWCKNHPLMKQRPRKPPVLGWPLTAQHLDVWWYLAHPESERAWTLLQAQERCNAWDPRLVQELQQAGLAEGYTRVAFR